MIKINELRDQFYSKTLSLPLQLWIRKWHSSSNRNGIIFPLLCSIFMSSVYMVDLLCHALVLILDFRMVVIRFGWIDRNLIWKYCYLKSVLFLKHKWYLCSIWLILCDTMNQLFDCVNYNFYIGTDSYVICFMIKFRMDSDWYDVSCIPMITSVYFNYRNGLMHRIFWLVSIMSRLMTLSKPCDLTWWLLIRYLWK